MKKIETGSRPAKGVPERAGQVGAFAVTDFAPCPRSLVSPEETRRKLS
jgi:hypothetical protein